MKSRWRSPSTISLKARVSRPTSSRERTGSGLREVAAGHAGHGAGERADGPGQLAREEQAQQQGRHGGGHRALQDRDVELVQAVEEDVDLVVDAQQRDRPPLGIDDGCHRADPVPFAVR